VGIGVLHLHPDSLLTMIVDFPRFFSPISIAPSISLMTAGFFGRRTSKISVTRGRPPVMSWVPEISRGVLARRPPAEIFCSFSTSM